MKQRLQDEKDRYDSDEETKKEMMTVDDRLAIINKLEYLNYQNSKDKAGYPTQVTSLR